MTTSHKNSLHNVMNLAWQFIKRNGYSRSEALKCAWANIKLRARLAKGIVKFYFVKVDGSLREAYGTLASNLTPSVTSNRKGNDTTQTYYDTEKQAWRCFKKANLYKLA